MPSVPDCKPVKDLFQDLLGRECTITPLTDPVVPTARRACCVGLYVDANEDIKTVVCTDLELAARSGAALGLVPSTGADSAIENCELPDSLYDNFYEVINILSSVMNNDNPEEHVKLSKVFQPGMMVPEHAAKMLRGLGKRGDFEIEIDGYGTGKIGIVVPL